VKAERLEYPSAAARCCAGQGRALEVGGGTGRWGPCGGGRERGKEDGPVAQDGPDGERLGCGGRKRAERSRPAAWCCLWAGKKTEGELGWAGNGERREGKVEGFVCFFKLLF
jgi:hypothetical protein